MLRDCNNYGEMKKVQKAFNLFFSTLNLGGAPSSGHPSLPNHVWHKVQHSYPTLPALVRRPNLCWRQRDLWRRLRRSTSLQHEGRQVVPGWDHRLRIRMRQARLPRCFHESYQLHRLDGANYWHTMSTIEESILGLFFGHFQKNQG